MDPQWMIVIIQLLLQSCQMKNTIAMCLISDMDYVQQQRMMNLKTLTESMLGTNTVHHFQFTI